MERLRAQNLDILRTVEVLRKKGVSFDIDGVEVESTDLSVRKYNLLYGYKSGNPKAFEDVKGYAIMVDWIRDAGSNEPWPEAVDIWNSPNVLGSAKPVKGTKIIVKFLAQREIAPYRISSRPEYTRTLTENWYLKEYGPSFDLSLIRLQEGQTINPDFKAAEIDRVGIGFHFEDSFENAELIVKKTDAVVILVPQPWNEDYQPANERIIKVTGFRNRMKMVRAFLTLAEKISKS